ncbi:MAG: hypothetical protein J6V90_06640 [Treponema sp.]|nr:hypothetical protein [Treponema sp.]
METIDLHDAACFGVAGNFTGHLEQAGEAENFKALKIVDAAAPKALFPTYVPHKEIPQEANGAKAAPSFLNVFPFDAKKIVFPKGEQKLQIEPEIAIVFEADWQGGKLAALEPRFFGASNDVSIRKEGELKISVKKNWGAASKGFSEQAIKVEPGIFDRYRIASYLRRDGKLFEYGENSPVNGYSYFGKKLNDWLLDKFNNQEDLGPAEDIHSYLAAAGFPKKIFVSVGATRYSDFGKENFLQGGDDSIVALYPDSYSKEDLERMILGGERGEGLSILCQRVVL